MTRYAYRFHRRPTRKEVFAVWNYARTHGEFPQSWSFAKHGSLNQTWWGFELTAR